MILVWDFAHGSAWIKLGGMSHAFHGRACFASLWEARAFLRPYGLALRRNAKAGAWDIVPRA